MPATETGTSTTDTPITVTPNQMPGAPAFVAPTFSETSTATADSDDASEAGEVGDLTAAERTELAKLRAIHKDESKWERRAKENFDKAQKFDAAETAKKSMEERLIAERDKALADAVTARAERLRSDISRETGVPPEQITGNDEEAMRASAEKALAWVQEFAKKGNGQPPTAPASNVTGDGKPGAKATQIQSRAELQNMTRSQILEADKAGRLDKLKGKV